MKITVTRLVLTLVCILSMNTYSAGYYEVTEILHHRTVAAIYLHPDPGPQGCTAGQPFLLPLDGSAESKEKLSMMLTALSAGFSVRVYPDGCNSSIWGTSRPVLDRVSIKKK